MEQKHKPSYLKYFDSKSMTTGTPSVSNSIEQTVSKADNVTRDSINSCADVEPRKNESVKKTSAFRGIRSLLPFCSGNKSKVQSSKKRKAPKDTIIDTPLSVDDVRNLIALYSKYENLYNPKNLQYGNKQIESIYYADMARSFPNKSGAQLQSYLNDLRVSFEREHAIIENARRRSKKILKPSIEYYSEFLFLLPFLNKNESKRSTKSLDSSASTISINTNHSRKKAGEGQLVIGSEPKISLNDTVIVSDANQITTDVLKNIDQKSSVDEQQGKEQLAKQDSSESKVSTTEEQQQSPEKSEQLDPANTLLSQNQQLEEKSEDQQAQNLDSNKENLQAEPLKETQTSPSACQPFGNLKCQAVCSKFAIFKIVAANQVPQEPGRGEYGEEPRFSYGSNVQRRSNRAFQQPCQPDSGRQSSVLRASMQGDPSSNRYGGNAQQVQVLCDMIRAELSSAPDFIYYDAKWRIIEILREVNKRQLVHKKGLPQTVPRASNASALMSCTQRSTPPRTSFQVMPNSCPYCTYQSAARRS